MKKLFELPIINNTQINNSEYYSTNTIYKNIDNNEVVYNNGTSWYSLTQLNMLIPIFDEDWESGDFNTNNWVVVNDDTNKWIIGTSDTYRGTYSLYISNDNTNPTYDNSTSNDSHIYVDVPIPNGISDCIIEFQHKGEAEVNYDYMRVYNAPTTYTPTAGNQPDSAYQIGKSQYNDKSVYGLESISIGNADAGTTRRFIFSWHNDGSVGTNPATIIDNIKIKVKY